MTHGYEFFDNVYEDIDLWDFFGMDESIWEDTLSEDDKHIIESARIDADYWTESEYYEVYEQEESDF